MLFSAHLFNVKKMDGNTITLTYKRLVITYKLN